MKSDQERKRGEAGRGWESRRTEMCYVHAPAPSCADKNETVPIKKKTEEQETGVSRNGKVYEIITFN